MAIESFAFHLQARTLDRRAPLRDQIYDLIRSSIIIGQLRPGQPINELEIGEMLGVSRTPVREAVKRISDEGLIDVFAQNGTFVSSMSRKGLEEAYIIRNALELESVRRAADRMTREHEEALEGIITMHEHAILRRKFADAIRLDDQFHRYIAEISDLTMLWRAVDISKAQMDRGRYLAIPNAGLGEATIVQHKSIVAALAAKNGELAMNEMRHHLDTSLQNTLNALGDNLAPAQSKDAHSRSIQLRQDDPMDG